MSQDRKESHGDTEAQKGSFPRLKAIIGSYCIHCGLTSLLVFLLSILGVAADEAVKVYLWYFLLGWIPVVIWIYPVLKRKLRWI